MKQTTVAKWQLERWNALRERAGEEPIDATMAEAVLSTVDRQTRREMLDRLGDWQTRVA